MAESIGHLRRRWPGLRPQTRPLPAMARLLRASCLLSLLLAGFVPPGRGQEKSKVSEPRGWGPGGMNRAPRCPSVGGEAPLFPDSPPGEPTPRALTLNSGTSLSASGTPTRRARVFAVSSIGDLGALGGQNE